MQLMAILAIATQSSSQADMTYRKSQTRYHPAP